MEAERLRISDAESAYKAISDLVIAYTGYPSTFKANNSTIRWNMLSNSPSIGLFPQQGAIYLRRYVSGSYVAQIPFEIVYRTTVTTNKSTVDSQELLTALAKYLEESGIEFDDEKVILEEITRTTPVFLANQNEKVVDFAIDMQLKYTVKGD